MAKSKGRRLAEWLRNLDSNSKATKDTIANSSIDSTKLEDDAVTNPKIADGAVHTANIADTGVTFAKLHTALVVTESDGIGNNDNDTTVATSAAIKDYVDTAVAGKDALSELSGSTDDITEGSTNLYYTDARADARVALVVDSAPATLNTLNELAAALGDDANFSTTTATSLGNRLRVDTAAQGLTSTQQANARTNLGLGTAATTASTDYVSRTFLNTNNLVVNGTSTANQAGFLMRDSESAMMFQIYGTGTQFGFLDAAWGNWDLKKTSGGALEIDINGTLQTVYHTGNLPTIPTNNNQLTNGAGYITSFDITTQTDPKYLRSDTSDTFTGNLTIASGSLTLPAGYNLQWGSGYSSADATIWSDGTASIIRMAPTGNSSGKTLELKATENISYTPLLIDADWGAGSYNEALTVYGTYPSYALRSTTSNSTFLQHIDSSGHLTWYFDTTGNTGTSWNMKAKLTSAGVLTIGSNGSDTVWSSGNDGSGSGLDADSLDGYTWGTAGKNVFAENFDINSANGNALRFWGGSTSYQIAMSAQGASGYGRMTHETTSDYNMYFRMSGTNLNRGFVFQDSTNNRFGIDQSGNVRAEGVISSNNKQAMNCAHWSAAGNTTGAIKITLPGGYSSVYSMPVIEITTYRYSGDAAVIYRVSGHNWNNGVWYNTGVTSEGGTPLAVRLGHDGTNDCIIIGETNTVWVYGSVTVSLLNHPSIYASAQNFTSGWGIGVITSMPGTVTAQTIRKLWHTSNDGSGSGLDADLWDGNQFSSYLNQALLTTSSPTFNTVNYTNALYAYESSNYIGSDPRWNASGYNANEGCHHFYATTGSAGQWGQTGLALYSGAHYNFFTTKSGDYNFYANNSKMWTAGNDGSGSGLDADLLDGYNLSTSGANIVIRTQENGYILLDNWMRIGNGTGLYCPNGAYFYNDTAYGWFARSSISTSGSIRLQTSNGTNRGWYYADTSYNQGFLTTAGGWALTVDNSGNITATGNVTAYSDLRLKEDIKPLENALAKVLQLRGVQYTRKDTKEKEIGVIAQEIESILPEVVHIGDSTAQEEGKEAYRDIRSVDYGRIVSVLIEAIKEQQAQINELKEKIK